MAAERQTGGVRFILDPTSGVPFYRQVIMHMEMAIADGRLCTGNQLPTVRALAVDLQINPNTVARAYNELEIRGIVNTQQGTGTFVSEKKMELTDREREETLAGACSILSGDRFVVWIQHRGSGWVSLDPEGGRGNMNVIRSLEPETVMAGSGIPEREESSKEELQDG